MARKRKLKLAGTATLLITVFIALIALIEKGAPYIPILSDASFYNLGPLGASELYLLLRSRYSVYIVTNISDVRLVIPGSSVCVYAIISPSVGYTEKEAQVIVEILRNSCGKFSVLIADEYRTSNSVLSVLNSSIRITGSIVLNSMGLPYPRATISVGDRIYTLTLDIASSLSIEQGGASAEVAGFTEEGFVIAAYEYTNRSLVYVIGDSSIFLNQVLTSNATVYRDFVLDLFDYLCYSRGDCVVVLDDSHHVETERSRRYAYQSPLYILQLAVNTIARVLHPSFWLPPLVEMLNRVASSILISPLRPLVLMVLILVAYIATSGRFTRVQDRRLSEQAEREFFTGATAGIRGSVLGGRVKLGRQDFINLYSIVDSILRSVVSVGLGDPRAIEALRGFVGPRSDRFFNDMNRLYAKATGRKFLPLVFSWDRAVRKMIRECEGVLNALGTTLMAEKGVEYVLARGLVSV